MFINKTQLCNMQIYRTKVKIENFQLNIFIIFFVIVSQTIDYGSKLIPAFHILKQNKNIANTLPKFYNGYTFL